MKRIKCCRNNSEYSQISTLILPVLFHPWQLTSHQRAMPMRATERTNLRDYTSGKVAVEQVWCYWCENFERGVQDVQWGWVNLLQYGMGRHSRLVPAQGTVSSLGLTRGNWWRLFLYPSLVLSCTNSCPTWIVHVQWSPVQGYSACGETYSGNGKVNTHQDWHRNPDLHSWFCKLRLTNRSMLLAVHCTRGSFAWF